MKPTRMLLCLLVLACLTAAGCNTTEGFGRDLEAGGRKIKNEAREHNN